MTGEGSDIGCRLGLFHAGEEFGDVRGGVSAISGDDGGDAHADKIFSFGKFQDVFRMGVHIDKPRGNNQSFCVQFDVAFFGDEADAVNLSVGDAQVGMKSRIASAVDDASVADDDFELGLSGSQAIGESH